MSTSQQSLMMACDTAANFNAWGSSLAAVWDAMGLTRTTDTGQVNWTTNSTVPTANTYPVYEIRKPASDPLQTGSTSYYLKLEYGSSAGTLAPSIRFSIGTGTSGAGTLTGSVSSTLVSNVLNGQAGSSANFYECDFSWDSSRFGSLLYRNHTGANAPFFWGLERTKNSDGTDSSDGVTLTVVSATGKLCQTLVFGTGAGNALSIVPTLDAGTTSSLAFSLNIPISPVFPSYGKLGNPMTICAGATQGDVVEGAFVTSTLYGNAITYLCSKVTAVCKLGASGAQALLMRYQ